MGFAAKSTVDGRVDLSRSAVSIPPGLVFIEKIVAVTQCGRSVAALRSSAGSSYFR
jgi:hypothetical protein